MVHKLNAEQKCVVFIYVIDTTYLSAATSQYCTVNCLHLVMKLKRIMGDWILEISANVTLTIQIIIIKQASTNFYQLCSII